MLVGRMLAAASTAEDTLAAFHTSDHNLAVGHILAVHMLADRNPAAHTVPAVHILVGHSRSPSAAAAAAGTDWPSRQREKTQPSIKNGQQT